MKLVEALKNLKTIEKRIGKNCELISEYAAYVSVETPMFETPENQTEHVASLIQSTLDLEGEYRRLKVAIELTNLSTKVKIGEHTHSISELITIKGAKNETGSGRFILNAYSALNAQKATARLTQVFQRGQINVTETPKVVLAYKEEDKQKALREWEEFFSAIDGKLEVVNAETDLINY